MIIRGRGRDRALLYAKTIAYAEEQHRQQSKKIIEEEKYHAVDTIEDLILIEKDRPLDVIQE